MSVKNVTEAKFCVKIYKRLQQTYPSIDVRIIYEFITIQFSTKVGIITPYKQQLAELKNQFKAALDKHAYANLDMKTVDGYQGREKEIIILSCVRAHEGKFTLSHLTGNRGKGNWLFGRY